MNSSSKDPELPRYSGHLGCGMSIIPRALGGWGVGEGVHAQRRVPPLLVVEDLDPLEDRLVPLSARGPVLSVEEFGLQRGEEALGDGVRRVDCRQCPSIWLFASEWGVR
jgi:hypothetical protein